MSLWEKFASENKQLQNARRNAYFINFCTKMKDWTQSCPVENSSLHDYCNSGKAFAWKSEIKNGLLNNYTLTLVIFKKINKLAPKQIFPVIITKINIPEKLVLNTTSRNLLMWNYAQCKWTVSSAKQDCNN